MAKQEINRNQHLVHVIFDITLQFLACEKYDASTANVKSCV